MRDFTLNPMPSIPRKGAGELVGGEWSEANVVSIINYDRESKANSLKIRSIILNRSLIL